MKPLSIDSIFVLKEHEIVQAYNNSFEVSWKNICLTHKMRMIQGPNTESRNFNAQQSLKFKKEQFYKATRHAFISVQVILKWINPNPNSRACVNYDPKVMKLIKRFIVHACHLIQNLTEIMPGDEKLSELSRHL